MAASLGTMTLRRGNGMTVSVDLEVQDAAGANATFDSGAGAAAGSDEYRYPEAVSIVNISLANVTTATAIRLIVNGVPTSHIIRHNLHNVSTIAMPISGVVPLNIGLAANAKIQFVGLA